VETSSASHGAAKSQAGRAREDRITSASLRRGEGIGERERFIGSRLEGQPHDGIGREVVHDAKVGWGLSFCSGVSGRKWHSCIIWRLRLEPQNGSLHMGVQKASISLNGIQKRGCALVMVTIVAALATWLASAKADCTVSSDPCGNPGCCFQGNGTSPDYASGLAGVV